MAVRWVIGLAGFALAAAACCLGSTRLALHDEPAPPEGEIAVRPDDDRIPLGAGREVSVRLPSGFERRPSDPGRLEARPVGQPGILVSAAFIEHLPPHLGPDSAAGFVRTRAARGGAEVAEVGGKVFYTDTSPPDPEDGTVDVRWVIGYENAVVLITLTVRGDRRGSEAERDCAERAIPFMIESLRK